VHAKSSVTQLCCCTDRNTAYGVAGMGSYVCQHLSKIYDLYVRAV